VATKGHGSSLRWNGVAFPIGGGRSCTAAIPCNVFKNFTFKRYNAQFRVELFNIFNDPIITNPYDAPNGYGGASGGTNDMGTSSTFGCGCSTPDVAAGNPIVGSGSSRVIQLGMKFTF